jgi:hypothetical protein
LFGSVVGLVAAIFAIFNETQLGKRPVLQFDSLVDIEEVDHGSQHIQEVFFRNIGDGLLVISNFKAGCSCTGVYIQNKEGLAPVNSVTINPGNSIKLLVKVVVNWNPDITNVMIINFNTNAPGSLTQSIRLNFKKIYSGAISSPLSLSLGKIELNSDATFTVDVYDDPLKAVRHNEVRKIIFAEAGNPATPLACTVKLLDGRNGDNRLRKYIGTVVVSIPTSTPHSFAGFIAIHCDKGQRSPTIVPIDYKVSYPVYAIPDKVILPRRSHSSVVYSSKVMLSVIDDSEIHVVDVVIPPELVHICAANIAESKSAVFELALLPNYFKKLGGDSKSFVTVKYSRRSCMGEVKIPIFVSVGGAGNEP